MRVSSPMMAGPRITLLMISAPFLDRHLAVDLRIAVHVARDVVLDLVQHAVVGLQHVDRLAGVDPPAAVDVGLDPVAVVDQPLDGVGDLQLAAPGRVDAVDGLEDRGG